MCRCNNFHETAKSVRNDGKCHTSIHYILLYKEQSFDVNVLYYIAEWHYAEGDFQAAVDYCTEATHRMGVVDDASRSDVYGLLGAAYFRQSAFDKAVEVLNHCYKLDKKTDDFDRMSSTLNSIASVFVAAGKPQEAEKYVQEAIAANSLTKNLNRRAVLFGTASELYRSLDDKVQCWTMRVRPSTLSVR